MAGGVRRTSTKKSGETDARVTLKDLERSHNVEHVGDLSEESIFNQVDTDHSGTIDRKEFKDLVTVLKEEAASEAKREQELETEAARAQKRVRVAVSVAVTMVLFLAFSVAANVATTFALLEATKEMKTDGNLLKVKGTNETVQVASADFGVAESGLLWARGSNEPVATAERLVSVPLLVAPVLNVSGFAKVNQLFITYYGSEFCETEEVKHVFKVAGASQFNSTHAEFWSHVTGQKVRILNGVAEFFHNESEDSSVQVCSSDVECSFFQLPASEAEGLMDKAVREVEKVVLTAEEFAAYEQDPGAYLNQSLDEMLEEYLALGNATVPVSNGQGRRRLENRELYGASAYCSSSNQARNDCINAACFVLARAICGVYGSYQCYAGGQARSASCHVQAWTWWGGMHYFAGRAGCDICVDKSNQNAGRLDNFVNSQGRSEANTFSVTDSGIHYNRHEHSPHGHYPHRHIPYGRE